ncbi:MAG: chemotaxis protein CheW [Micavibrio sp.]|nr:chemotaxis protein CheW [Micavibrio sp.]
MDEETGPKENRAGNYLTVTITGQLFAVPILQVQDVLGAQKITRIPLAPPEVAGALNLRGRIVTVIDARTRLGLPKAQKDMQRMSVVVEQNNELYSILIDEVGDVMALKNRDFETPPPTLDEKWRSVSSAICRLEGRLMVLLDVEKFLGAVHLQGEAA